MRARPQRDAPPRRATRRDGARARGTRPRPSLVDAGEREHFALEQRRRPRRSSAESHTCACAASLRARRAARRRRGRSCCGRRGAAAPAGSRARIAAIVGVQRVAALARVDQHEREIGALDRRPRALDADALDRVVGVAQARGVDDGQRNAADLDLRARPCRASCPAIGVTIAASSRASRFSRLDLPTFGRPDEHDGEALAQQRAGSRAREHARELARAIAASLPRDVGRAQELDVLVGKVERRLGEHAQLDQRVDERVDLARERAGRGCAPRRAPPSRVAASIRSATLSACARSSLPLRNARLRELAGLGEARAELDAAREQQRAAPRGRRVRAARARPRRCRSAAPETAMREPVVDRRRRCASRNVASVATRGASGTRRRSPCDRSRATAGAGDAHDADAAAAGRRRRSRDRVGVGASDRAAASCARWRRV